MFRHICEGQGCIGRRFFSTLGGKRYCWDKDAVSSNDYGGVRGSGTKCETWGLYALVGGGGRRYCGERAGATVKLFGVGKEGAGVWCGDGLGVTLFGGKRSWGKRVVAGKNICVLRDLFTRVLGQEVGGVGEIFIEGMEASTRTERMAKNWLLRRFSTMEWLALAVGEEYIAEKVKEQLRVVSASVVGWGEVASRK